MSIRAIWVSTLPDSGSDNVLYSRKFITVEKRAKIFAESADNYVKLPEDSVFYSALVSALGLKSESSQFSKSDVIQSTPVFELSTREGKLWPVIVIEQHPLILCCLPLVENGSIARPPLIEIPGISIGFSLLLHIAELLGPSQQKIDQNSSKLHDLRTYLHYALPFGTPINLNVSTVMAAVSSKASHQTLTQKQPAWKPVLLRGVKSHIYFHIHEFIRAVQYDRSTVPDVWDVYGRVSCKAELEGVAPDITVNLSVLPNHPPISNLIVHPCVMVADTHSTDGVFNNGSDQPITRRIRFSPPVETHLLCHYSSLSLTKLPIQGFYQMRGDQKSVKILVQLKLHEKVKNSFDYCEVQFPFYNRGSILNYDAASSVGTIVVGPDKRRLVWNVGQRFPSRNLEAELKATVNFDEYSPSQTPGVYEDPFCVELNAYAQILFKISDYTHSGCIIDQKSMQIHPSVKARITTVRELMSADYKIWNSHGDCQMAFQPPAYL
ncbi:AP-5 complex subunit mu-1-like [Saccoglossus kowalevskii]|uniref:AP-5 complex subunit mu-1 n=1 Tax=Saccoglossus kowalevskii TaxID=10224 RepID=A0ABM0GK15_SACKO|nr:PREDICTED: AP-5 complex subunit mu-1-like [Saccoglossus kowalevskii]